MLELVPRCCTGNKFHQPGCVVIKRTINQSVFGVRQENSGNKMKGFKLLLRAAEAGDRSSMITMAKAFDTGVDLSADRSVETVQSQFQGFKRRPVRSEINDF